MDSKRKFRLRTAAAALTAVAALVTGCTGTGDGGAQTGEKPSTLRVLYTTAEANAAAVQSRVDAFEKEFGIALEVDTQPYDALQQRVFSEIASSSSHYDIFVVDTPWAPAIVGSLEPLSGYISDPAALDGKEVDLGDFIPKVLFDTAVYNPTDPIRQVADKGEPADIDAITAEGFDVYGLPIQANAAVMAYRKDLFEDPVQRTAFAAAYGRELTVPKTWAEYAQVAEFFIQPESGLYGTTVMAGVGDWATDDFKTLLASFGGDGHLVSDDLSLAFDSDAGVRALEYYRDLIASGAVPPGSTSASWEETATSFDNGMTAMTINYHALELADGVPGEIGYAQVPAAEDAGPHFGTWMLSINKNSVNKSWAYRAIAWLTSADQQLAMVAEQLHPSRTSVYEAVAAEGGDRASFYSTLGESLAVGVGRARLTNYMEVSHAVAVAVNRAATGEVSAREAIDEAAKAVTLVLEQAGYTVAE